MIRIPLRDLRVAFSNPVQYAQNARSNNSGTFPRKSKYSMLLFAVGELHKTGNLKSAQDYLERKITLNFKSVSDLGTYIGRLRKYASEFASLGNTFFRVRDKIVIETPSRFAGILVSGQAARIDLVPTGGYAVWVFVRNVPDWDQDPRLPLLQSAYSKNLGREVNDVSVGVYDFTLSRHASKRYSRGEIEAANKNLTKLLETLQNTP
jgi:hypothetical protein